MRKTVFVLITSVFFSLAARAADILFDAQVDKTTLTMNDTLTLQLSLSGGNIRLSQPNLPPIAGFQVYSSGQSQNFSFVNGQASSQVVYSYALVPQSPGAYTIPAFSLSVNGQTLQTSPIPVKVLSGSAAAPPSPSGTGNAEPSPAAPRGRRDLFVTTSVDKKKAFVGEPVTLTFRFYSRVNITSQPRYTPPETSGFLAEDLPPNRQYATVIDGQRYSVVELKTALFAASPGTFTIGPASLECRVEDFSPMGGDPFQSFFQDFFSSGRAVTLRSDPLSVTVLPLPEADRPASFRGDVGRYRLTASLDKTSAEVHEPLTLTVTVAGEGNVKAVTPPRLGATEGFKIYETVESLNVSKENGRVQGSKVFKTVLKPDVSGTLEIPPVSFVFFDPALKAYRTVSSAPLKVTVRPSTRPEDASFPSPAAVSEGVKVISQDIRFIKKDGTLTARRKPFSGTRWFWFLNFFPPLAFSALWLALFLRSRADADRAGFSFRRARRKAQSALRRAESFLRAGDHAAYDGALRRILMDYLGEKMKRPPKGLLWDDVDAALKARAVSPELIQEVKALWEELDRVRYSSVSRGVEESRRHGREAAGLLDRLEAQWKA